MEDKKDHPYKNKKEIGRKKCNKFNSILKKNKTDRNLKQEISSVLTRIQRNQKEKNATNLFYIEEG